MVKSKVLMFSDPTIINIQPSLYHEADIDIFAQKCSLEYTITKKSLYLVHEGLTNIQARVLNQGPKF